MINQISAMYAQAQDNAVSAVNRYLIEIYWQIGKYIVEFEQGGKVKAAYGASLLEKLARDLSLMHGKGFSRSNLTYMRLFYQRYPICETASHKLSWSHTCELVKIDDPLKRSFYEKQTILENWSTTELKRPKKAALFGSGLHPLACPALPKCRARCPTAINGCDLRPNFLTTEFLYRYFDFISKELQNQNQGTSIQGITSETLSNFPIPVPQIEEQTRIAHILADMDAEIAALEHQLAKYRMIKQGMMQHLLTGKIWVVGLSSPRIFP